MPVFDFKFKVQASLDKVAAFHHDTSALKLLSPTPVQFHRLEPLAERSQAEFTMWFGPFPIHWTALHTEVDPQRGFTDTQVQGPLKSWRHTHRFSALDSTSTQVHEHIEYQHDSGLRGLFSRLLFSTIGLRILFAYRRWITRRALRS